ncbi:uncharacterized protein LOC111708460 [Eurytemora carolleeae]|uniref:uncharacterized protein LOC111708460 n=1 Tax=Eurytemora carolleeae TaxID=1294199 RepID=UPI000C77C854|nr:uncharacterized protein LOC111708460 [Eurytemora carolleeae]|eukprot:XP_023337603.1 uncharacterized protein LOC111708460 [Eurytemora affinis]
MDFKIIILLCLAFAATLASPLIEELTKTKDGANSTMACPAYGIDCYHNDVEEGHNTNTWEECAIQCRDHHGCLFWTWKIPELTLEPRKCYLKYACDDERRDSYAISGPYDCFHY